MLEVVSMENASLIIEQQFSALETPTETMPIGDSLGRVLANSIVALEGMPPFNRSAVDGFAVQACDTFGCSSTLPALLSLSGSVAMGTTATMPCDTNCCIATPTGAMVAPGANAVVMVEHTEDFHDGTIGILQPVAPGDNVIFENDEVEPGQTLITSGTQITPHHIAALASLGISQLTVHRKPRVAIISTGDEIIEPSKTPHDGQMRDTNGPLLTAAVKASGAHPEFLGIAIDEEESLERLVTNALTRCDLVLVSGGSSVGQRDNTQRIFERHGNVLFHGIAMKPGKPTILANLDGIPAFGLPGHPMAAYFVFLEFVRPLIEHMTGNVATEAPCWQAVLTEAIPSNHGRSECVAVRIERSDTGLNAIPIRSKSGLISLLSRANGYLVIPREQEGISSGTNVVIKPFPKEE